MRVFLDISRILARGHRRAPTGIDRVELAYARWLPRYVKSVRFCYFADAQLRVLPSRFAESGATWLARRWEGSQSRGVVRAGLLSLWQRPRWRSAALHRISRPVRVADASAYLLNVSHWNWERLPKVKQATGMRLITMIHDLMPLTAAAHFPKDFAARFERGLHNLVACADLVVTNSHSTAADLRSWSGSNGRELPALSVLPLGQDMRPAAADSKPRSMGKYFIFVGSLHSRKNLDLLNRVWQRNMLKAPLLLVGSPDRLAPPFHGELAPSVRVLNALADREVRSLIKGSLALLVPSWCEGFGLPVVEALSLGVPVICSDLPALREVGQGIPTYLPPHSVDLWQQTLCAFERSTSSELERQREALPRFRPNPWRGHFEKLRRELTS